MLVLGIWLGTINMGATNATTDQSARNQFHQLLAGCGPLVMPPSWQGTAIHMQGLARTSLTIWANGLLDISDCEPPGNAHHNTPPTQITKNLELN